MGSGSGDYGSGPTVGPHAAVLGALGTLIGYIGTEISADDLFERLLWPQKFYNRPSVQASWKLALLMPMGGPLHKASLRTLDGFYKMGLFKDARCGHMLGTAFFGDTGRSYRVHERGAAPMKEYVRNGMWVRVIDEMPMLLQNPVLAKPQHEEAIPLTSTVRQEITVSHLVLRGVNAKTSGVAIMEDTCAVSIHNIGWLIITESVGIAVALLVALVWKSAFTLLWLLPLFLKLLSACFAISREGLKTGSNTATQDRDRVVKFDIIPNGNGFQVIEGKESLILQFFRHFGHPIRCRSRELLQMTVVILFGLLFPLGLLCSLLWMPMGLQCVWLGYQLYAVVVLHVYHFAGGKHWASTEEKISRAFRTAEAKHEDACVVFGADKNTAVHATLVRTSHDSFAEGRAHVGRLLSQYDCEKGETREVFLPLSRDSSGSNSPNTAFLAQEKPGPTATAPAPSDRRDN